MRELVLSLAVCSACATRPHIELEAPPTGAPFEERAEAYERNRPAAATSLITINPSGGTAAQTTEFIVLGDGRRVYHAEDLAPLVPEGSATANAGQRSAEAYARGRTWSMVGWALIGAGAAFLSASFLDAGDVGEEDFGPNKALLMLGFGSVAGGLGAQGIAAFKYGHVFHDERVSAFTTYDRDLRARLDVCVDGTRIVACTTAPPAVAPAPAVAPGPSPAPAPSSPATTPPAPASPAAPAPPTP